MLSDTYFPVLFRAQLPCKQLVSPTSNERETRPLVATVYFSIEHARARHAPRDTFDVNFICHFIFRLKCLYKGMQIYRFPASRGLSRRDKLKREERDLCGLPTSCLMKPPTKLLVETFRFSKPVSFNV